jgi:hypothetical protein
MKHARIERYLRELPRAVEETGGDLRLLPVLFALLLKAPRTLVELARGAQGSPWPSREACPRCRAPQVRRAA